MIPPVTIPFTPAPVCAWRDALCSGEPYEIGSLSIGKGTWKVYSCAFHAGQYATRATGGESGPADWLSPQSIEEAAQ